MPRSTLSKSARGHRTLQIVASRSWKNPKRDARSENQTPSAGTGRNLCKLTATICARTADCLLGARPARDFLFAAGLQPVPCSVRKRWTRCAFDCETSPCSECLAGRIGASANGSRAPGKPRFFGPTAALGVSNFLAYVPMETPGVEIR